MAKYPEISEFFEEAVPTMLRMNPPSSVAGTLCFVVDRVGAWTVTLGPEAGVAPADELDADLVLFFSRLAFNRLMTGESPEPGEGFTGHGDEMLLEQFTRLLLPAAQGATSLRATSF